MKKRHSQNDDTPKSTKKTMRLFWLGAGWFIVLISPLIGAIPGPGFIILFPIGLALILKNSLWAKRKYAQFSQANPEYGQWANWALRRPRAKDAGRPPTPDIWNDIKRIAGLGKQKPKDR